MSGSSSWPVRRIDELATVTRGASPRPIIEWITPHGIPWVKIGDANASQSRFIRSTKEFIKPDGAKSSVVVYRGDFIVSNSATPGVPRFIDMDQACIHDGWLLLRNFKGVLPEFLYYRIIEDRESLISQGNGSVFTNLKTDILKAHLIALPQLAEQRAIASTLGALDDKIESNRRTIRIALEILDAQSYRFSSELPSVPLSSLVTVVRDSVNPSSLGDHVVDLYSLPSFDAGARPESIPASTILSNKLRMTQRTILVSRLNPRFNRTWWAAPRKGIPALTSTEFAPITAPSAELLAGVWLAIRNEFFREELTHRVTGTSGSHQRVRPDDMLSIEVPDVSKLTEDVLSQALGLLELVEQKRSEIVQLAQLRDALLPELLSGQIRVAEANA